MKSQSYSTCISDFCLDVDQVFFWIMSLFEYLKIWFSQSCCFFPLLLLLLWCFPLVILIVLTIECDWQNALWIEGTRYALYMCVQCQNCPVNLRLLLSSLLLDKNNKNNLYVNCLVRTSQIFFKDFFLNLLWLSTFQEKRAQRKEKNDEIDSVKLKTSVQGENSGYKPRGARETLNKFEGKENTKDTTTKPVTVSRTTF